MLHSSTINFDVALHEILPALTMGGRVVMRGPQMWELDRLSQVLAEEQVTFSRIPTAYWQQWLHRLPDAARLPRLRQVTVGGEGLPGDALKRWQAGALSHIRLDNLYGPTETTVAALFRQTQAADGDEMIVPIGVPYPGRSAIVLDADGNPVPAGGFGELCIGGESLARGYLDRPGLTAERFVPDPFGVPGSRLYRSGDLCRQRADGTMEFLGRLDQQIKLRGFRIELGEIEAVLRRCAGVKEAVAAVKGEGEGKRLIGYVVGEADPSELQRELARTLPDHMVPSELMVLPALPLMPNGKVDRAVLPEPELVRTDPVAPRSSAEATLLSVWRRVLKRDDIGVSDNFFALGGDSILSLQVIARAREAGLKLTPKQLFEHPTIATSAAVAQPVGAGSEAAQEIAGPLPLTPIQARFFELHPEGPAHWNQAVLLRVPGELDGVRLDQALQALVARHDALRLRFERSDGTRSEGIWRQRVAAQETNALIEVIDLGEAPDWRERLEAEGTRLQQSLDLARGPLLRAGYFHRAGHDGRLLLAIHHLAVDGVSWRVLLQELQQMLAQIERGEAVSLPPAGTPWSVWATKLAEHAQRPEVSAELTWWQDMLAPADEAKLPVEGDGDRSLGASQVLTFQLDAAATKRLSQEAPRAYRMRIDEVLLATLARTLASWSRQNGVLIHLEGHGREDVIEDVDLSRTVGWFTTRYPVWLAAGGDDDAATLLDTKERLRAVPHKGFQFGLLHYLGDAATAAAIREMPQAEVSFNYLGQIDQDIADDGRFGLASERAGLSAAATSPMAHLLDLNGRITDGVLSINWRFSPAVIAEPTVQRLIDRFAEQLDRLINHCAGAEQAANKEVVAALAAHLNLGARELPSNIVPLNDLGYHKTVFCLHPGYGLISEFRPLARELNGVATAYGVQSPILSEPAWRAASFDAMAADYADRIRRIQPEGPYYLLGWSFGGRLAVSIARHLEASRCEIGLVGLVDIGAPIDRIEVTKAELKRLKADLPALLAAGREVFRSEIGQIIPGRRTLSGDLIAGDEQRLVDAIVEVVVNHRKLLQEHQYPRIDTRLHLWWATHPPKTPDDRDWRPYTSGGVEVHDTLEATHATIIRHPDLAAHIRAILSKDGPARTLCRPAGRVEMVLEQAAR
jgi:non-ribosomal peptide synthase protein (TIGR01720 family)